MAAEPRIQQNYTIPVTGGVTAPPRSDIGLASTVVLSAAPERKSIIFHNPNIDSNENLIVCQAQDTAGNAVSATIVAPAGGFIIFPGASLPVTGDAASGSWKAAASASGQSITIITSSQRP